MVFTRTSGDLVGCTEGGGGGGGGGGLFKFKGLENVLSHILDALFAIGTKLVRINVSRT